MHITFSQQYSWLIVALPVVSFVLIALAIIDLRQDAGAGAGGGAVDLISGWRGRW